MSTVNQECARLLKMRLKGKITQAQMEAELSKITAEAFPEIVKKDKPLTTNHT